jgi:hypothetical protein
MKKLTRLEKSTHILSKAKATQWCYVNTENEFYFMDTKLIIDNSVEEYKVHNKAGSVEDYTNEAYMEEILVVIDNTNTVTFYNQNYDLIDSVLIKAWYQLEE